MIAILCCFATIGVFVAGFVLEMHTFWALVLLGFCVNVLGMTVAAAETHGFEGGHAPLMSSTLTTFFMAINKWAVENEKMWGDEPLYVQTPRGPEPIRTVFFARLNQRLSIVLDTAEEDGSLAFNAAKQGIM